MRVLVDTSRADGRLLAATRSTLMSLAAGYTRGGVMDTNPVAAFCGSVDPLEDVSIDSTRAPGAGVAGCLVPHPLTAELASSRFMRVTFPHIVAG
jgi:hypothetical protein